ncbi:alpha/beta fold hydrolase [Streptomonospora nanhaiensis]|uniref:Pimeloyl-ACP methyl ester carboxylesterase n=1 Tax=Streptomonospora nanhaiensis TaxID=1323731 RepID=A0A853BHR4_9ACTN|nr:alpha/beta hydrolase [Streptomonospora nanhaiensis]MBV2364598.1 alpha/beta hydrolase [Streptomonospora nanhaiensis]MBX9387520.1 alpha/beta hydrolase [Streptomonospora nanhaiensis]NYI94142.1 pimeloyl-ACP methyl ester carboxylesterase [Streptomonospora nanhaiensis]
MGPTLAPDTHALTLRRGDLVFDALATGPADGPPVLFLHGFPEFATCWRAEMAACAQAGFRAVAVDQRGYSPGARPADTAAYAVPHLVGDVLAFADALGAERFHLVGHDWGGVVAWPTAADHPERITSLTSLSTPHPRALAEVMAGSAEQRERLGYIRLFRKPGTAEEYLLSDGADRLAAVYEGRVPEDLLADNVRRLSEEGALTAALNWYRALARDSADAGTVAVPTLYVWGEHDLAYTAASARATGRRVSGPYWYVELDGASHWLPEEAADRVVPPLLEHLRAAQEDAPA